MPLTPSRTPPLFHLRVRQVHRVVLCYISPQRVTIELYVRAYISVAACLNSRASRSARRCPHERLRGSQEAIGQFPCGIMSSLRGHGQFGPPTDDVYRDCKARSRYRSVPGLWRCPATSREPAIIRCPIANGRVSSCLREREELSREVERRMAVKCCKVPDPDAIKDRKQCQRVLGGLPKRLCRSISTRACSNAALVSDAP